MFRSGPALSFVDEKLIYWSYSLLLIVQYKIPRAGSKLADCFFFWLSIFEILSSLLLSYFSTQLPTFLVQPSACLIQCLLILFCLAHSLLNGVLLCGLGDNCESVDVTWVIAHECSISQQSFKPKALSADFFSVFGRQRYTRATLGEFRPADDTGFGKRSLK